MEDFKTSLTSMDRSSSQKINKKRVALYQMDLVDIFRIFHSKILEYTIFCSVHDTFPKIDYMLGLQKKDSNSKRLKLYRAFFSLQWDETKK